MGVKASMVSFILTSTIFSILFLLPYFAFFSRDPGAAPSRRTGAQRASPTSYRRRKGTWASWGEWSGRSTNLPTTTSCTWIWRPAPVAFGVSLRRSGVRRGRQCVDCGEVQSGHVHRPLNAGQHPPSHVHAAENWRVGLVHQS